MWRNKYDFKEKRAQQENALHFQLRYKKCEEI
jgi:hypothetical protein